MTPSSLLDRFLGQPRRFRFDAALRLLMLWRREGDPARVGRFRTPPNLSYPSADVLSVIPDATSRRPDVTVGMAGLTGPSGVLPRYYTEQVMQQARLGAHGLHVFLDLLSHRMIAAFGQAGIKYRAHRSAEQAALADRPDPHRGALLALVGEAREPGGRNQDVRDVILHHAGAFAAWPRSAERLEAILSDWAGRRVEVRQFVGSWLDIPEPEQTRLPRGRGQGSHGQGNHSQLGVSAAVGTRAWDPQSRIILRLGPMPLAAFHGFMPWAAAASQIVEITRAYLGPAASFAINPVIVGRDVPRLRLAPGGRLGWDTWLPKENRGDAADAVLSARLIERLGRKQAA